MLTVLRQAGALSCMAMLHESHLGCPPSVLPRAVAVSIQIACRIQNITLCLSRISNEQHEEP